MKKLLSAIFILIALASFACNTKTTEEHSPETYTWTEQGIEFTYNSEYKVHDSSNLLFVTKSDSVVPPEGEIMMELMITTSSESLDQNLAGYDNYQEHTVESVTIGENPVSIVQYISELVPEYTYTVMILETESGTITFVPGLGHEDLAEEIVKSVKFL